MPVKYKLGTGDTVDITAITKTNQGVGSGLDADLLDGLQGSAYEKIANKGVASGYASLDAGGKVPSSQLPALALTDIWTVASQAAQLALVAEEGDIAIRTDQNKSYAHNGGVSGTMADWSELLTPTDTVLSVFGRTGAVVAAINDYTWGQINKTVSSLADITTRTFTLLTDVPSSYIGQAGKLLKVKATADGLEYFAQGSGGGLDADLLDGKHAPAGAIVGTTDTQTLTNKTLINPIVEEALLRLQGGGDGVGQIYNAGSVATFSANAKYSAGVWNRDNTSLGAANIQISSAQELYYRTAGAGANPISWLQKFHIDGLGNIGFGTLSFGASAEKVISMFNGVAPTTSPADIFQLYSADQVAGNACPNFRTENGSVIKLYKESAVADASGGVTIDTECRTAVNALLARLRNIGLVAT